MALPYLKEMGANSAHIILNIDTERPIEIGDFVGTFSSLGNQFEKFVSAHRPDLGGEAKMYVKEVRRGSIEVDLIPIAIHGIGTMISAMEQMLILENFVRIYSERLHLYFSANGRDEHASKSDLKDFTGALTAIANDPHGKATLEAAYFEDGKKDVRAAFQFTTAEARSASEEIEKHKRELEGTNASEFTRVLMTFAQSNIKQSPLGKRTGEQVVIEDIARIPLPLIYSSDLAEERIKHEIREADDNVYKKGFVVDVNVQLKNGRPVAYRIVNVHQVIELPSEE